MFDDFLCCQHHFFCHEICIDVASMLEWIWVHLLMLFDTFSVRVRNWLNLQTHLFFRGTWVLWFPWSVSLPVLALIRYESWHRFWLHVGSPLVQISMFCVSWLFDGISMSYFSIYDKKRTKSYDPYPPFFRFVRTSIFDVISMSFVITVWFYVDAMLDDLGTVLGIRVPPIYGPSAGALDADSPKSKNKNKKLKNVLVTKSAVLTDVHHIYIIFLHIYFYIFLYIYIYIIIIY